MKMILAALMVMQGVLVGEATISFELTGGWTMQSSALVHESNPGAVISRPGYNTTSWYQLTTFPATVLAGLLQSGEYPNLYYGNNLQKVDPARFDVPWWYRVELDLSSLQSLQNLRPLLTFKGINYRANIWLNGHLLETSKSIRGTFVYFTVDASVALQSVIREERAALAIEVFRPYDWGLDKNLSCRGREKSDCLDLAISWVDWAPTPQDANMGLWRGVFLDFVDDVTIRYPSVQTSLTASSAELTIRAEIRNWGKSNIRGTINCVLLIGGNNISVSESITLSPGTQIVELSQNKFEELKAPLTELWWPWQMEALGSPKLHSMTLSFQRLGSALTPVNSESLSTRFGIRETTKEIDERGNALFRVNGHRILIRGGGYAPDLLQRMSKFEHQKELDYVRHLGLNSIRLEGKFPDDSLFEIADEMGILVFPGFCCCDAWQQWPDWGPEQHDVASISLKSQLLRLQIHPSIAAFLYSSDAMPPAGVEREFLNVISEIKWFNPTVSSASYLNSTITGVSGVKMTGPYGWVPPNFWSDPRGTSHDFGSAFGFITETSPGAAPVVRESFYALVPESDRWNSSSGPTATWDYHCGSEHGVFGNLEHFTPGLYARLGQPSSAEAYLAKAQIEAYESHRAMFEAYTAAKYTTTGIIQWMLNNGWPQFVWHLFEYDFNVGGSFFGAKKALEAVHLQYNYADQSVIIVNSMYRPITTSILATARVFNLQGELVWQQKLDVQALEADVAKKLFKVANVHRDVNQTMLVVLTLQSQDVDVSTSKNVYFIPYKQDVFQMGGCLTGCVVDKFANMTDLSRVPNVQVSVSFEILESTNTSRLVSVKAQNHDPVAPALFVRLRAVNQDEQDVLPVFWSDNFVTVLGNETVSLKVSVPPTFSHILAEPFNNPR